MIDKIRLEQGSVQMFNMVLGISGKVFSLQLSPWPEVESHPSARPRTKLQEYLGMGHLSVRTDIFLPFFFL